MGKGDIRTRRGKIWRRTYGVTRPRRYKTVVKPHATTRKAKTLKDLPKVAAEAAVKKPVVEVESPAVQNAVVEASAVVETATAEVEAKKPAAKKAPAAKKVPAAKKAPAKKK